MSKAQENDPRHILGRAGERQAEKYLRGRGLKTIARRFTTPVGELDLVMREGRTVVFVEVKTLRQRRYADPEQALRPAQQRRLLRAARWFVRDRGLDDRPCRFDVVGVVLPEDGAVEIEHFPDAFLPGC